MQIQRLSICTLRRECKMKKFLILILLLIFASMPAYAHWPTPAGQSKTNTTNFDGNLAVTDDTVQKALDKLDNGNKRRPIRGGNPATSSLFIVNPFTRSAFTSIFSTHPPIKNRISRLESMAEELGQY